MKIWCDVCDKKEASVFCCADEAALCDGCDHHVHSANKLAGKHLRFSLSSPSFKDAPLCDTCGERRALLFCQEDRSLLCRECDIPIHRTSEHTEKHKRFLLSGRIKLSASPSAYPIASKSCPKSVSGEVPGSTSSVSSPSTNASNCYYGIEEMYPQGSDAGTGTISDYLMETLPVWRVDDLLENNTISNNSNESYTVYDASLPFHHQGFWDQKPFP